MSQPANTQFAVAVHVLTLLAAHGDEMVSSELLARSVGANPVHVRRVLNALGKAGLVRSRPGPSGGWLVTRDAAAVTLREVHDAVLGDSRVLGLHDAAPECSAGQRIQAALGGVERRAAAALRAELARTTLADVLAETGVDADWAAA